MNYTKILFFTIGIFLAHLVSAQKMDTVILNKKFSIVFPCRAGDDRMINPEFSCNAEGELFVASAYELDEGFYEKDLVNMIGEKFGEYTIVSQKYITGFGRDCYYAEVDVNSNPTGPYCTILVIPSGSAMATFYTLSSKKYSEGTKKFFDSITLLE